MSSQQEANEFGEAVWGAIVATLIVIGLVSKFWPYILGAVVVLALGVWWWRARRRRHAQQADMRQASYQNEGDETPAAAHAPTSTSSPTTATAGAVFPSPSPPGSCTCDGPPHPFSPSWCAPNAAAVTSPSRSAFDATTDADEWARRLDSDAVHADPWARAKLNRQAQLLRYLAHPSR